MKKTVFVLVGIVICAATCRAQSVAQTLVTLTGKVSTLEARPATGSPLIATNDGGKAVARLGAVDDSGFINLHNKLQSSTKPQLILGFFNGELTGGLYVANKTGDKTLAYFGSSTSGTSGYITVNGTKVRDYAEVFDIADCHGLIPGSVVAASLDGKGIQLSSRAYDPATTGVLSGAGSFQPGMRIGSREDGSTDFPVAVAGQVYVRVNAEAGSIKVGDLLVSSSIPGVAMRGADANRLTGTVIGKALQPYAATEGQPESLIRMLVLNR